MSPSYFGQLYDKHYPTARALKYSGTARIFSTVRPNSDYYRPLTNPPPVNSSYHKYGNLIGRLELLEALLHFAYAFWAKDLYRGRIGRSEWGSMTPIVQMCKMHWKKDAADDREKILMGLM